MVVNILDYSCLSKFTDIKEDLTVLNKEIQDKLWKISLELCADEKTNPIANKP